LTHYGNFEQKGNSVPLKWGGYLVVPYKTYDKQQQKKEHCS